MKKHLFLAAMLLTLGGGAAFAQNANPFFNEKYGTPHEIPPFEKFTMENYREAILKGMDEQRAEHHQHALSSTNLGIRKLFKNKGR